MTTGNPTGARTKDVGATLTKEDVDRIAPGDVVTWVDPDAGACTRSMRVKSIRRIGAEAVSISDESGGVLEAFLWELHLPLNGPRE